VEEDLKPQKVLGDRGEDPVVQEGRGGYKWRIDVLLSNRLKHSRSPHKKKTKRKRECRAQTGKGSLKGAKRLDKSDTSERGEAARNRRSRMDKTTR